MHDFLRSQVMGCAQVFERTNFMGNEAEGANDVAGLSTRYVTPEDRLRARSTAHAEALAATPSPTIEPPPGSSTTQRRSARAVGEAER